MKKYSGIWIILIAVAIESSAQIPNSGFENWTSYGNGMKPEGWWTTNDSLLPEDSYFPVTRSADHYPPAIGSYSMRLENNPSQPSDWAKAGITWPGDWEGNDYPSFAIDGHPVSLCGYYKFIPQQGDTMRILMALFNNGEEVTQGLFLNSETVPDWTPFRIFVSDTFYAMVDSARIMISSFNAEGGLSVKGNSVLYVDNLSFDTLISPITTSVAEGTSRISFFNTYPNPACDHLTIELMERSARETLVRIFDLKGKSLLSRQFSGARLDMDVRGLPEGFYFLSVASEDCIATRKIAIIR